MSVTLQQSCDQFITRLQTRNRITLDPYDLSEWLRGTYTTVQRKVGKRPDREQIKTAVADFVVRVRRANPSGQDPYDRLFYQRAWAMTRSFGLSFGISQKLLNIIIKYHFCYYHSKRDPVWNAANEWIATCSPSFHIPIDSKVMANLLSLQPIYQQFIVPRQVGATFWLNQVRIPWTKLTDDCPYKVVQYLVREDIRAKCVPFLYPLEYELAVLWR